MIDTIVAQSTAPGPGAVAVVRISGPSALDVALRICPALPPEPVARHAYLTAMVDPETGGALDRGLATWFRGPESYTGEDLVELSCHGGWLSPALVMAAAVARGCRPAEPGEFSRRAYLNGKLDLLQAEAVDDLVRGRSLALRRAALNQLDRGLSGRVDALRTDLVHLEALLAHHIDFPEEDEAPVARETIVARAREVGGALAGLLRTAPEGQLLRDGAVTVLAGRPNAGKSSLFNALLGQERAIVTEEPGTTRDAVEATVTLGGYPFRLVDTAGIRETRATVERLGVEVARRYLEQADVVLLCVDGASPGPGTAELDFVDGLEGVSVVLVRTRADLLEGAADGSPPERGVAVEAAVATTASAPDDPQQAVAGSGGSAGTGETVGSAGAPQPEGGRVDSPFVASVTVSSVTGSGLDGLRQVLPALVYGGLVSAAPDAPVLTRPRHVGALRTAAAEVEAFARALDQGVPAEVASTHLRPAETALEELLGTISVDDVLDRVFRDFCIGK